MAQELYIVSYTHIPHAELCEEPFRVKTSPMPRDAAETIATLFRQWGRNTVQLESIRIDVTR